jgi:hypothetical protein
MITQKSEEYPSSDPVEQALEDVDTIKNFRDADFNERRLVDTRGFDWPDDILVEEVRGFVDGVAEVRPGWKAPEVRLARIVRGQGL